MTIYTYSPEDYIARARSGRLPPMKQEIPPSPFDAEVKALCGMSIDQFETWVSDERRKNPTRRITVDYWDGEPLSVACDRAFQERLARDARRK